MQEGIIEPFYWEIKFVCESIESVHSEGSREIGELIQQEEENFGGVQVVVKEIFLLQLVQP
jgi:hypothetical protein